MRLEFQIIFIASEDGWITAYLPELPGAIGQGRNKFEARQNLKSAIAEVSEIRRNEDEAARQAYEFASTIG